MPDEVSLKVAGAGLVLVYGGDSARMGTDLGEANVIDGRYQLLRRLGVGGMSVVWLSQDQVLRRSVAVKLLASALAGNPALRKRFEAEALAAAQLCHPHVINVYDYGEHVLEDGTSQPYLVMEVLTGCSLTEVLSRGRMPWQDAVFVCAETAEALAAAHSHGIVHRDVSPANVMLTGTGVKMLDFGVSALTGDREREDDGTLLGTPAYLAPERVLHGQVGPATDVYALGLLLYQSLTGRLPFKHGSTTDTIRAHLYHEPDPLPIIRGLPLPVAEVCQRCLSRDPDDRPSSVELAGILFESVGRVAVAPMNGATSRATVAPDPGEPTLSMSPQEELVSPLASTGTRLG